jgi:hypothetical protein
MFKVLGFLFVLVPSLAFPQSNQPATAGSAQPGLSVHVDRYTEYPLADYQERVMNEATKLSLACRLFRYLYGRWPSDIQEIERKATGIDFGAFMKKATVTPVAGDAEKITVFDGTNVREAVAVPVDFHLPESEKLAAQKQDFKIDIPAN